MLIFLKFIGIVLLVLILLALALLLIVMCTPLRYCVQGGYHDEKPNVQAKLSIWFSALAAYVTFTEEGLSVCFRIFGIRKDLMKQAPKERKKQGTAAPEKVKVPVRKQDEEKKLSSEAIGVNKAEAFSETEKLRKAEEQKTADIALNEAVNEHDAYNVSPDGVSERVNTACDTGTEPEEEQQTGVPEPEKAKSSGSERLSGVLDKLKGIYNKVQELIAKLQKLYRSARRNEEAVKWFLDEPSTKHMITTLKKQAIKILKSILPKKLTGELRLGMENPAAMGQICMFGGMFYPVYEKHFSFTPVFGEKVIEGEGFFKGRIILGEILAHVAPILLMRDLRRFLNNVKILMIRLRIRLR